MRNRRARHAAIVVAMVLLCPSAPGCGPDDLFSIPPGAKRVDLSGSGGFLLSTDWSDLVLLGSVSTVSGALEQVLVRDLVMEPGPVYDGVVTYWEGRYGFRRARRVRAVVPGRRRYLQRSETLAGCRIGRPECLDVRRRRRGRPARLPPRRPGLSIRLLRAWRRHLRSRSDRQPAALVHRAEAATRSRTGRLSCRATIRISCSLRSTSSAWKRRSRSILASAPTSGCRSGPPAWASGWRSGTTFIVRPSNLSVVDIERFVPVGAQLDFGFVHNLRAAAGLVISFGR